MHMALMPQIKISRSAGYSFTPNFDNLETHKVSTVNHTMYLITEMACEQIRLLL